MQAIKSLADVQDQLLMCYVGPDIEMFKEIAPWCCKCDKLAFEPLNCFVCQEAIICGKCHEKGERICVTCQDDY